MASWTYFYWCSEQVKLQNYPWAWLHSQSVMWHSYSHNFQLVEEIRVIIWMAIYTRGEIDSNPTLSKEQISQSRPFIWLSSNGSDQISQLHSKGSFVYYKSQKYLINFHCKQNKFLTHQPWTALVVDPPSICLQSAIYPPTICCSADYLLFRRRPVVPPLIYSSAVDLLFRWPSIVGFEDEINDGVDGAVILGKWSQSFSGEVAWRWQPLRRNEMEVVLVFISFGLFVCLYRLYTKFFIFYLL